MPMLHDDDDDYDDNGSFGRRSGTLSLFLLPIWTNERLPDLTYRLTWTKNLWSSKVTIYRSAHDAILLGYYESTRNADGSVKLFFWFHGIFLFTNPRKKPASWSHLEYVQKNPHRRKYVWKVSPKAFSNMYKIICIGQQSWLPTHEWQKGWTTCPMTRVFGWHLLIQALLKWRKSGYSHREGALTLGGIDLPTCRTPNRQNRCPRRKSRPPLASQSALSHFFAICTFRCDSFHEIWFRSSNIFTGTSHRER